MGLEMEQEERAGLPSWPGEAGRAGEDEDGAEEDGGTTRPNAARDWSSYGFPGITPDNVVDIGTSII
jgi:hypothetical protein